MLARRGEEGGNTLDNTSTIWVYTAQWGMFYLASTLEQGVNFYLLCRLFQNEVMIFRITDTFSPQKVTFSLKEDIKIRRKRVKSTLKEG